MHVHILIITYIHISCIFSELVSQCASVRMTQFLYIIFTWKSTVTVWLFQPLLFDFSNCYCLTLNCYCLTFSTVTVWLWTVTVWLFQPLLSDFELLLSRHLNYYYLHFELLLSRHLNCYCLHIELLLSRHWTVTV